MRRLTLISMPRQARAANYACLGNDAHSWVQVRYGCARPSLPFFVRRIVEANRATTGEQPAPYHGWRIPIGTLYIQFCLSVWCGHRPYSSAGSENRPKPIDGVRHHARLLKLSRNRVLLATSYDSDQNTRANSPKSARTTITTTMMNIIQISNHKVLGRVPGAVLP
jgi:hypothetical protein